MKPLLSLFFAFYTFICFAQPDSITGHQLAGNLLAYPYLETAPPKLTPAPQGYVPFHMEHYGRHGSRWLLGPEDYLVPVQNLEKAEKAGLLTPLGLETLEALRQIEKQSNGRLGELSDIGALQHQAIGKRMALNFPEIFTPEADLTAKSTTVIRCIISMANALEGIQNQVPGIHFEKDASQADMWFMNFDDKPTWAIKDSVSPLVLAPYRDSIMITETYLSRLVSDPKFAQDSVKPGLLPRLYWVLGNTQSHSGQPWLFEEVFSREELMENWKAGNAGWFLHGGNSKMTDGKMPFVQRNLLKRIIERTDSSISTGKPGANLRFGHDGILVSIITLMELGGYGREINSFEQLEKSEWKDFEIIPMAGNLQLIFYRPADNSETISPDDILVKAMINEREVSMPGNPVTGNYYNWKNLRDYYISKINQYQ
ncbi:MAG: histidine-type phosphatase [Muribaculaceae bacterium]|nr:histidine-type phosphatase [Muribaculaceae bacterium]